MKVLVTGATGFIGNYVVEELLQKGHEVIASSANSGKAKNVPLFDKVTYKAFDLSQFDPAIDYYDLFDRPANLIHLAWEGLPNYKSSFHEEVNLPRHLAFLKSMIGNGLTDLTVTGTCFEYGMQEGSLKEDMPAYPDNPYGKAKNSLRVGLEELQKQYSYILKWARLFYMYGKGQNPNSLLAQLDKALENKEGTFNMSGGQQTRDFLPVEKVAANIVKIALQEKVTGVINCCSGVPVTVENFVKKYLEEKKQTISLNLGFYEYPTYEPMHFWGDATKLNTI